MQVLKEVLGIDVAQNELVVTLGRLKSDLSIELYSHNVFKNKETGFAQLQKWVSKQTSQETKVHFVMEATGVYHQKFAHCLRANNYEVSIVLPNKISNYMRTLDIKTITDKTCSEAITRFGLERKLDLWECPKQSYRNLQQLTRERAQVVEERVMAKNQLHAEETEAYPNANSIKRIKARIEFLNNQEQEIKKEITQCVNQDPTIKKEVERICSIPGVGELTAAIVLAETNGFELIRNKKQLVSYAGLDIKEKQSGTSVKGKPRISKKGNKNIRRAMHLPALAAIKRIDHFEELYKRIVEKSGIKMKGVVAVQRKLLELIYIIAKGKNEYQNDYEKRKREQPLGVATL